jgi:metallophosphoesterase (TIGR00282 family)
LKEKFQPDLIIVNGENAAHGFGITSTICRELYSLGIDVITLGNHAWDQKEIISTIDGDERLLRPINSPPKTPGRGAKIYTTLKGHKVLVVNVMGQLFMNPILDDPFKSIEDLLKSYILGHSVQAIIIDIHAEASSEKRAMGHIFDGRVSAVFGTHTHIPTADAMILPKGTGYQTDVGMCGDYHSILGMQPETPVFKFLRKLPPPQKMEPATGEATLGGVFLQLDRSTGLCTHIQSFLTGGVLGKNNY